MINTKQEAAISLPFRIDGYGNVVKTTDQQKIWADRVASVIGTIKGERVMDKVFGTEIPKNMFENLPVVQEAIRREVANSFSAFLPKLRVETVDVDVDEQNGTVVATITYSLPNKDQVTTSVGIAVTTNSPVVIEERL